MSEQMHYPYDVFISYAQADQTWVWDELLPRLEGEGRKVIVGDRDFEPGASRLKEMERAALQSRKTLLVLSPAYVESEWAEFENTLVQTLDPAARKRRLIPVVKIPCQIQLRIRPLVSVDLTAGDEAQWQRLIKALDPNCPTAINPIQNLALAVAEPSAALAAPSWHPQGSVWLALGMLGVVLLTGLIYLLLYDWPALGATVSAMVGAVAFVLGLLGVREDKDFFRRLSHFLGKSRPSQAVMATVLVASIALWGVIGQPKVDAVRCGNLGCKPPGVQRLAIGEFTNLSPGPTEFDSLWTKGTVEMLKAKFTRVSSLQIINQASDQVTEQTKLDLDYWVEGNVQVIDQARLSARLSGRGGQYLSPDVQVVGEPADTLANVTTLQNALALALLKRLGVEVSPVLADTIAQTPTGDLEALKLNNEGVDLLQQGDFVAAESKFRAALSLDSNYGAAYSNLGFALASQGQYPDAIAAYQAAIERLPGYAVFHYNLGHLYAESRQTGQALLRLNEAIRLDPHYIQAYNELGNVYIEIEQWSDARRELEHGLALDATFAPLHKNLGRVALAQGKPDEAIASLQTALQLYEHKPLEAIYWLAEALAEASDKTAACQQLAAYWALDPNRISQWAPNTADLAAKLKCP